MVSPGFFTPTSKCWTCDRVFGRNPRTFWKFIECWINCWRGGKRKLWENYYQRPNKPHQEMWRVKVEDEKKFYNWGGEARDWEEVEWDEENGDWPGFQLSNFHPPPTTRSDQFHASEPFKQLSEGGCDQIPDVPASKGGLMTSTNFKDSNCFLFLKSSEIKTMERVLVLKFLVKIMQM